MATKKTAASSSATQGRTRRYASAGRAAGEQARRVQREAEQKRQTKSQAKPRSKQQSHGKQSQSAAVQPPGRQYPTPPLPKQHQPKPGLEAELKPRPRYETPEYRGSGKLQDMVALVTGADSGI